MKENGKLGIILLGLWLVLTGLIEVTGFDFNYNEAILSILAAVTGITFLVEWLRLGSVNQPVRALGMNLLGAWLLLTGFLPLVELFSPTLRATLWAVLAIIIGIVLLLG